MIKIVFTVVSIFVCLSAITFSQQYWIHQPCPTTKYLTKLSFVDSAYGWASGDSGVVVRTTNGGTSWIVFETGLEAPIEDLMFVSHTNGWILGNNFGPGGSYFKKTTDGGSSWISLTNPDTTNVFLALYFFDANTGFTGGLGGRIYKTTDSGFNWQLCSLDSSFYYAFPVRTIRFLNSQYGIATGGQYDFAGVVWMTTDGGLSWKSGAVSPEPVFDAHFFTPEKLLLVGGDYEFGAAALTTTNQGANWAYEVTGCYGVARSLTFRTPSEVWAPLSFSQLWAVSLDSGKNGTWNCIPAPDTTSVYDAVFLSPTLGWAVGCLGYTCRGSILKYNPSVIGIEPGGENIPGEFMLFQNYPNPFNSSTVVKYYIKQQSDVLFELFDAAGREVKSFSQKSAPAGFNHFTFDAGALATGVYFYRITAGSNVDSKKMVLLK